MSGPLILDSVEIDGFRGFRSLRVERLGRVNLIVGRNNVGKTALLEAIWLYANKGSPSVIWSILESRDEGTRPQQPRGLGFSRRERAGDRALALKHLFYGRIDLRKRLESLRIGPLGVPSRTLSLTPSWSAQETVGVRLQLRSIPIEDVKLAENPVLTLTTELGNEHVWEFLMNSYSIPPLKGDATNSVFIRSNGLGLPEISELWDAIALTSLEGDVLTALKIIEADIDRINLLSDAGRENETERVPKVRLLDEDEPVLLRSLGEGMNRLFGIALALVNAKSGILLIDEIENGLHYSVQPDVWKLVFETAARLDVQVFATTHSWDCVSAFQSAAAERDEEGLLLRLEEKKGDVAAVLFDRRRLGIATRDEIEIR